MIIRQAKLDDVYGITTAHVRSWQHAYKGIVPQDYLDNMNIDERIEKWRSKWKIKTKMQRLVVDLDSKIAGFSAYGPPMDDGYNPKVTGEIYAIYMHPDYIGHGYGRTLITQTLEELRSQNYKDCIVWTLKDNQHAIEFYQRAGFKLNENKHKTFEVSGIELDESCFELKL